MHLSYWEIKSWFSNVDFCIIGSGIVGLNCALALRQRFPKSKILVLEKGILPQGASTKNAGFACFGSLSEILSDLQSHSEEEVLQMIRKRVDGLKLLRKTIGDKALDYKQFGGYELFPKADTVLFDDCKAKMETVNQMLKPIFNAPVFQLKPNSFNFKRIHSEYIYNVFEGQVDTGKMMKALLQKARLSNITVLNNLKVNRFSDANGKVDIEVADMEFSCGKLFIATNGFATQLLNEKVKPARAQVLITKPIDRLHIKGTFHIEKGYYYFRNIDKRILLGGGRHLDFEGEATMEFNQTQLIQDTLEKLLETVILPHRSFEIEQRWSGIMGVGSRKTPIIKQLSNNVYCGVRLGGMGVAIGSAVGQDLANLP